MKRIPLTLVAVLAGTVGMSEDPPLPAGGFDPAPFPELRDVGEIRSKAGLFRIPVDAGLHRSFNNLRLAKRNGEAWQELPMVSRRVPGPRKMGDFHVPHRIESLDETPDGALEIVVAFDSPLRGPIRLEIDTPLIDFEKGVSIAIPGSAGNWEEVLSDGVIFDHRRFLDFRHTSVQVPAIHSRTLRLRIADATDTQRSRLREITRTVGDASGLTVSESSAVETRVFRIDGLRFVLAPGQTGNKPLLNARGRDLSPLPITSQTNLPDGSTEVLLDGGHLPLTRLILETTDRNFRRAISIQIPGSGDSWRTIHRTNVHRFEVGDFRDENLSIPLTETRAARWRLLVENGANAPITFPTVSGEGPAWEIFFLADPGDRPALFLGGEGGILTKASLDTAAIEASVHRGVAAENVTAGEPRPNPDYRIDAVKADEPGPLDSKPALWVIIALAVAVLIGVLYQALRKIEEVKEEG